MCRTPRADISVEPDPKRRPADVACGAVDSSTWESPASLAQVGGFRPPQDPRASWFGTVPSLCPGQPWPTADGEPMLAFAQINLGELPSRAPAILSL
jgi:Domain of unknown function (DUF1963)